MSLMLPTGAKKPVPVMIMFGRANAQIMRRAPEQGNDGQRSAPQEQWLAGGMGLALIESGQRASRTAARA